MSEGWGLQQQQNLDQLCLLQVLKETSKKKTTQEKTTINVTLNKLLKSKNPFITNDNQQWHSALP